VKREPVSIVLRVLVVLLLAACGEGDDGSQGGSDEVSIAATTTIVADLARNVAGDRATVEAIVPAGADPHDFEPAPADVQQIAEADLVLELGLGYDEWTRDLIDQSGTNATVVVLSEGVPTIKGDDGEDEHEDDPDVDPHVWFDVANAKTIVVNIRDALIDIDPTGRTTYEANATAYLAELEELDSWIREQVATVPDANRKLVTTHDAFGYYVAAYGFKFVGAIIPSLDTQAQASARQIEDLLNLIEQEGVRAIFTETTINPDLTEQIAAEAGVAVVTNLYSDSLSDDGSATDTYIGIMRHNTSAIVDALR
jgi:zinc/manganese transport system substrate-binding protein/manganese/iron transport system substrate-binding protein